MTTDKLNATDDATVLAIASQLTVELTPAPGGSDATGGKSVTSPDEARAVLAQLIEQLGETGPVDAGSILATEADSAEIGRRLLGVLLADPPVAPVVEDLIENPPSDDQMSIELAIGTAVILGMLVMWLQTKISLRIHRHDGKTDIDFELKKMPTGNEEIKSILKSVAAALGVG